VEAKIETHSTRFTRIIVNTQSQIPRLSDSAVKRNKMSLHPPHYHGPWLWRFKFTADFDHVCLYTIRTILFGQILNTQNTRQHLPLKTPDWRVQAKLVFIRRLLIASSVIWQWLCQRWPLGQTKCIMSGETLENQWWAVCPKLVL